MPKNNKSLTAASLESQLAFRARRNAAAAAPSYRATPSKQVPYVAKERASSAATSVDKGAASAADSVVTGVGLNPPYDADKRYEMFDNSLAVTESFDAMYRAIEEPWNEVSYEGIGGGQADRVRHFYWQGKLTQKYGPVGAALLGLAHEVSGFTDQTTKFLKGKYSLDDLLTNYLENIEDTKTNTNASAIVTLKEYARKLAKMDKLSDDELREMAIDYATGVPRKKRMAKRDAYLKELRDSPEYVEWQNQVIDAAVRGVKAPLMPQTLMDMIRLREFRRTEIEKEKALGARNLEAVEKRDMERRTEAAKLPKEAEKAKEKAQ